MLGEQLQHVIEEADAGGDLVPAAAFDLERAANLRFFGVALNGGSSHHAEHAFQLIDVVENRDRRFRLGTADINSARRGLRGDGDADERHTGGAGAARVIHRVADVPDLAAPAAAAILQQAVGRGLCAVTSSMPTMGSKRSDGAKRRSVTSASQRMRPVKIAKSKRRGEAIEQAVARDPPFAQDQAVRTVAVKQVLEVIDHGLELDGYAALRDDVVREFPIVVPAAVVLVVLDLRARDGARR